MPHRRRATQRSPRGEPRRAPKQRALLGVSARQRRRQRRGCSSERLRRLARGGARARRRAAGSRAAKSHPSAPALRRAACAPQDLQLLPRTGAGGRSAIAAALGRLRRVRAARHHRQRQDRGVPAPDRAGARRRAARAGAGAGDRAHAAAASGASASASTRRSRCCTRHSPTSERLAAWRDAFSGHARIVLGTRSAVFAPVPELGPDRRRRGARRLLQAARGRLSLLGARPGGGARAATPACRWCSARRRRRSRRCTTWQPAATRACGCARRAAQAQPPVLKLIDLRSTRRAGGHRDPGGAGHRAPPRRGRPGAGVPQPARLRADAAVHRRAAGSRRAASAMRASPCTWQPDGCAAITAAPMRRCRRAARSAASR